MLNPIRMVYQQKLNIRTATFILIFTVLSSIACGQSTRIDSVVSAMGQMDFKKSITILNNSGTGDINEKTTELYLKAEIYLILGNEKFNTIFDSLTVLHARRYCDILRVKHALFIGSIAVDSLLEDALVLYPDEPELAYCKWLLDLDNGLTARCRRQAGELSSSILFTFGPWLALYYDAWSKYEYADALHYMDTLESVSGHHYISKNRAVLEIMKSIDAPLPADEFIELPYASCGPGLGMLIEDKNGKTIKMQFDTGTSYGLMTLHDSIAGNELSGIDTVTINDGVWYNYMTAAEDIHYKLTNLNKPYYQDVLIGYFNGKLDNADGCFSPFFFRHHAIHIDPIKETVCLRSQQNLARYKEQNKANITVVKYINRNGWIFIPCTVNGKEVLMMVETGSRDVNFNTLSTDFLGINVYTDNVKWRGKDYPVLKTDCTICIGDKITYDVKGGLISDFVIGNLRCGAASAGDLGPDFFRNFSFIIDPFNEEIIFEGPAIPVRR